MDLMIQGGILFYLSPTQPFEAGRGSSTGQECPGGSGQQVHFAGLSGCLATAALHQSLGSRDRAA